MGKQILVSAIFLLLALNSFAEDVRQRIPLAVDSDFQYQPVRANFPEQTRQEIKIISFETDGQQKKAGPMFIDLGPMPEGRSSYDTNQARSQGVANNPSRERDACITDASKRPTDTGVRVALSECYKKYGAK